MPTAPTPAARTAAGTLAALDPFGLQLIEQPLAEDDLAGHATLAAAVATPICLDESVTSVATAVLALDLGACSVINVKPARMGGSLEAGRLHDLTLGHGVPLWCGGMLETGLGRAANLALAALPGFTLTGDLSASRRYYARDLTPPFELHDGHLLVPTGPGLGVEVDEDHAGRDDRRPPDLDPLTLGRCALQTAPAPAPSRRPGSPPSWDGWEHVTDVPGIRADP